DRHRLDLQGITQTTHRQSTQSAPGNDVQGLDDDPLPAEAGVIPAHSGPCGVGNGPIVACPPGSVPVPSGYWPCCVVPTALGHLVEPDCPRVALTTVLR